MVRKELSENNFLNFCTKKQKMTSKDGSPCWVSAEKSCRWQFFSNDVRQSASFVRKAMPCSQNDTRRGPARSGTSDNLY